MICHFRGMVGLYTIANNAQSKNYLNLNTVSSKTQTAFCEFTETRFDLNAIRRKFHVVVKLNHAPNA